MACHDRRGAGERAVTRAIPFTKAQVRRAVEAATSAGLKVREVSFNRDGSFTVEVGDATLPAAGQTGAGLATWDDA